MNNLLICKYNKCKKYLLDPIFLPCSNNVCKSHVDELLKQNNLEHYKCLVCNCEHKIPHEGFILNTLISQIYDYNLHLKQNEKRAAESISKLKEETEKFKNILNDSENFIYEYISSVRNKIDLERERLINQINLLSDKMINQLNKYEKDCKQHSLSLNDVTKNFKIDLAKVATDVTNMKEEMRQPKIEKFRLDQFITKSNQSIKEIKSKCFDYKKKLLMNKACSFGGARTSFNENILGHFYFDNLTSYESLEKVNNLSNSILTLNESINLIKLCNLESYEEIRLLYQATRDGFSSDDFHEKCDGIPNTLTIIKVRDNLHVFGGFCRVPWDKSNQFKSDLEAFIFSLRNYNGGPMKIKLTDTLCAIHCKSENGPTFGKSYFSISNNSNVNQLSFSNLEVTMNSFFGMEPYKIQNFLAGSQNFTTEEIEVYQLV